MQSGGLQEQYLSRRVRRAKLSCEVTMFGVVAVRRVVCGIVLFGAVHLFAEEQAGTPKYSGNAGFVNVLMPQPATVTPQTGDLKLTPAFHMRVESMHSARLDRAVRRAMVQLGDRTGIAFNTTPGEDGSQDEVLIRVRQEGEAVQGIDEDESYELTVTSSGASLDATTVPGAMHGLQTLLQLVQAAGEGSVQGYVLPAVTIKDEPRFRWRGLMVDCGRHFEPVAELKRTLDGMAAVKMNVFHWHLTEDQGFRMESKRFPALTAKGSNGLFYTQNDAREIVAYARDRGIRVVPEFEMPGHSTAWQVAYPKLASGKAPDVVRREFGIADYALDPTREETYTFITSFLAEMTTIFPDKYVHIGGDETKAPEWKTNPRIQAFMKAHHLKDSDALQAYFNQRILKILTGLNKRMVGWDEILNPALPKDVVVQSWRGEASLVAGAKQGYQGLLSAPYYLDAMHSAEQHYLADPVPADIDLTAEQRKLILGGEVCMWSEQIDERTIDSRIWPRTAAIAERFWSPQQVKDVPDMYRRLDATSVELESLGLRHLSQEDAGLRELAGTAKIAALRTFASVFQPVSFSERYHLQRTSGDTELDRFVDAVRPDPPSRWTSLQLVHAFLANPQADPQDRQMLVNAFQKLTDAVPEVQQQISASPRLQDVQARAGQLAGLAKVGREAVEYLSSRTSAPAGWKALAQKQLEAASGTEGIVRFTILEPVKELVAAVQE